MAGAENIHEETARLAIDAEQSRLRGSMICPKCKKLNSFDSKYCVACGTALVKGRPEKKSEQSPFGEEDTPQDALERVYEYTAELMLSGKTRQEVERALADIGLAQDAASMVYDSLREAERDAHRKAGMRNMLYGGLWCVGGLTITAVTYFLAEGGGTFFVAGGAIIFGVIQFFRGLGQYSD